MALHSVGLNMVYQSILVHALQPGAVLWMTTDDDDAHMRRQFSHDVVQMGTGCGTASSTSIHGLAFGLFQHLLSGQCGPGIAAWWSAMDDNG